MHAYVLELEHLGRIGYSEQKRENGMGNKEPLLSICIPTRNRADVLNLCLKSIVEDPDFSDNIEIVVSDNCSTDNTKDIVMSYSENSQNIKYFRNDTDVGGDRNILMSLERGTGTFLKLNNDYSIFKEGALGFLLHEIQENIEEKPVLYFHKGNSSSCEREIITDFNDILKKEKWSMSWIGSYGYWKDDFQNFEERDRRISTMFQQVDWFIRSFKKKKKIIYLSKELTTRLPFKAKQGGYNFIEVHTKNYLIQFQELVSEGLLQESTIEYVKKEALLPSMVSWLLKIKFANKGRFSYPTEDGWKILKREFGHYSWYYPILLKSILKSFYAIIKTEYIKPIIEKFHKIQPKA